MRLTEALALRRHDCVAIVGGGGKTTIMYLLGSEATEAGERAVLGGMTRFTALAQGAMPTPLVLSEHEDPSPRLRAAFVAESVVVCTSGRGERGRWLPIMPSQVAAIVNIEEVGLTVLEADGSRNRPFKAPGEGEPAIPAVATVVLAVVGLDVVGMPLTDAAVHRPQLVAALSDVAVGDPVTPECVARVLLHRQGGQKGVPDAARWIAVLNKAEGARRQWGRAIGRLLLQGGAERVVLATAGAEAPDAEVMLAR